MATETIVLCADLHVEASAPAAPGCSAFDAWRQTVIRLLVLPKKRVNPQHRFAIATLREHAELVLHPTDNTAAVLAALDKLAPTGAAYTSFDLSSLVRVAHAAAAAAAASRVGGSVGSEPLEVKEALQGMRLVLWYCRSAVVPTWASDPPRLPCGLCVDAIYSHDKEQQGVNCPQEVFCCLEEQLDGLAQGAPQAYILEARATNIRKFQQAMAHLLAHPRQRPQQQQVVGRPLWELSGP
ncbi:hypothetical protein V8C86DRAFT_2642924 [Haematococcus lacustris]